MSAFVWLTWRQHRWTIINTAVLALAAALAIITTGNGRMGSMSVVSFYGVIVQLAFGAVIGMFWGAPLIARELEERTYFVAWGQDVTPAKWLRGKALLLGSVAVVLGMLIGFGDGHSGSHRSWGYFEATPIVQAGYAIFGFALGVLIGLLSRHVVTAMAATLVFYTFVRALLALVVRDHYLPAQRAVARWDSTVEVPEGALNLGGGFVGADLSPVAVPPQCEGLVPPNTCVRAAKAAVGTYVDYQPIERLGLFQFIEFGVCVLLAAGLFALTFRLLRRGGGWKPSRSHRRIVPEASPEASPETEEAQSAEAPASAQG